MSSTSRLVLDTSVDSLCNYLCYLHPIITLCSSTYVHACWFSFTALTIVLPGIKNAVWKGIGVFRRYAQSTWFAPRQTEGGIKFLLVALCSSSVELDGFLYVPLLLYMSVLDIRVIAETRLERFIAQLKQETHRQQYHVRFVCRGPLDFSLASILCSAQTHARLDTTLWQVVQGLRTTYWQIGQHCASIGLLQVLLQSRGI